MNKEDIGDFLYEQDRDDKDIEKLEKQDNSDYGDGMFECIHCGGIFDKNDLDRCDGDWICRECEEREEKEDDELLNARLKAMGYI